MGRTAHELAQGLADTARIVVATARLLWRHWPALLTLFLLGEAARNALLWLALRLGDVDAWAASAVVPLAPLAAMVAMVLMLRVLAPSLGGARLSDGAEQAARTVGAATVPAAGASAPVTDAAPSTGRAERLAAGWRARLPRPERLRQGLTFLASVLVPFVAVYQMQGYFEEDRQRFVNESYADALTRAQWDQVDGAFTDRTIYGYGAVVILLVLVAAIGLRRLMDRSGLSRRAVGWAAIAIWLEVFWLTWLASFLASVPDVVRTWASGRVLFAWSAEGWERVVGALGPVGAAVEAVWAWLVTLWSDVGVLAFTPLAWLTVGAVVYARPATSTAPLAGLAGFSRVRRLQALRRRAARAPAPVRDWSGRAGKGVASRFAPLVDALRTIRRAGVVPVVLFCLLFLLARQVEVLTGHAMRAVIGPLDPDVYVMLAPILSILPRATYTLVLVALLAAAVDRMLRHEAESSEPDPAPQGSGPGGVTAG